jgi:hypothetical protein
VAIGLSKFVLEQSAGILRITHSFSFEVEVSSSSYSVYLA